MNRGNYLSVFHPVQNSLPEIDHTAAVTYTVICGRATGRLSGSLETNVLVFQKHPSGLKRPCGLCGAQRSKQSDTIEQLKCSVILFLA
jgi:hypothetical protein